MNPDWIYQFVDLVAETIDNSLPIEWSAQIYQRYWYITLHPIVVQTKSGLKTEKINPHINKALSVFDLGATILWDEPEDGCSISGKFAGKFVVLGILINPPHLTEPSFTLENGKLVRIKEVEDPRPSSPPN